MSLNEVWQAASASPYTPPVSKDSQFLVGFSLLLAGEPDPTSHTPNNQLTYNSFHPYWTFRVESVHRTRDLFNF